MCGQHQGGRLEQDVRQLASWRTLHTGRSLNIVFFFEDLKYIPDSGLSRFTLGVSDCVHNGRPNTSAAAELEEFRKITTF